MNKKVAVLLVVFNEERHLKRHFEALKNQTFKNFTVYVVDNNSTDNSLFFVQTLPVEKKVISLKENLGFAKGNNIAARQAYLDGADFFFVLNPDIELDPECIEVLVNLAESNEKIAIVGPIMFYGLDQRNLNKIQSYNDFVNFKTSTTYSPYANQYYNCAKMPDNIQVTMVSGGITFMKRQVYESIGLFEEDYFIYNDEVDLAYRVKKAGYKMYVTHRAKVWHHHDWTLKNKVQNRLMYYYIMRNRFLFFKQYNLYHYFFWNIFHELVLIPLKIRWAIKSSDLRLLKYYYLGLIKGIKGETGKVKLIFN